MMRARGHASNPGIKLGIKSLGYMRGEATACRNHGTSDQASFRALDMNRPSTPSTELLVSVDDFLDCETKDLPPRDGPAFVGVDLGSSASMSAAVCLLA